MKWIVLLTFLMVEPLAASLVTEASVEAFDPDTGFPFICHDVGTATAACELAGFGSASAGASYGSIFTETTVEDISAFASATASFSDNLTILGGSGPAVFAYLISWSFLETEPGRTGARVCVLGACRIEKARSHLFEHEPRF